MPLPDVSKSLDFNAFPYKCNIEIHKNATFWWVGRWTFTDENDVTSNVNLSDATTAEICLESPTGTDTTIALTDLTADGKFDIKIQPADVAALDAQDYRWDCDIVLPVGNATFPDGISKRIFEGIATLHEEVSN